MADVILINPAYNNIIYSEAKIKAGVPVNPLLNLALLAAEPVKAGIATEIWDLNLVSDPDEFVKREIQAKKPRLVGITFTTPLFAESVRLAEIIKAIDKTIVLVAGGPHATTFPMEVLKNSSFDVVAVGEADFIITKLLNLPFKEIEGIVFKEGSEIIATPEAERMDNLDNLPFPAWHLYDLNKYNRPSLSNKASPPGYLETSRGCPWGCVFCNKNIQGKKFRPKSVKRVVDEIAYMLKAGFKEINFLDDTFSTDLNRAKLICEEIIRRGLKFPWHPLNGMRVDRVDSELFSLMKESGCYKVSFGIESGNQEILDRINKGIKLEQVIRAVKLAKAEGFETFGYFMLGLPGETERTMKETVRFAKKLKLDMAKFNITIPLPGTEIFKEWDEKGCIKTKDWAKYNFYAPYEEIYEHPTVPHSVLNNCFRKAYLSFYFDPAFILRRFIGGINRGVLVRDIKLFFKTSWFN